MYISVIIPTYKPGNYIFECLNSICSQTLDKDCYEIIVVLNGCKEPWLTKLNEYNSQVGERLYIIQVDQGGVSNARNIGIDSSRGDFIMFLDDDDYVSPSTLSDLFTNAREDVVTVFKPMAFYEGGDIFEYSRTREYLEKSQLGSVSINKVRKVFSGPVMKLIPRNVIGNRRFNTRFRIGEDSLLMFLISNKIEAVNFAPESAIYYRRIRENSATTSNGSFLKAASNSFALIKEYTKIYFKHPLQYSFSFYITRVLGAIKAVLFARGATF